MHLEVPVRHPRQTTTGTTDPRAPGLHTRDAAPLPKQSPTTVPPAPGLHYTPPVPGWYQLTGETSFEGSSSGTWRGASWLFNGTLPIGGTSKPIGNTTASTPVTVAARSVPVQFDGAADAIQFAPFQNSGATIPTATGFARPHIAIYYAGPA
ncbi:hypothetical protein [Streptomyces sp. MP131-18]|uniref:hypothetical protein n=1 Tax=Streptomyces sp. MP131-18 TaxID=1857892 RepID=UPI0011805BFE|nr:hypothetical protein [Streptomyces sp. MP131-18]